MTQTTPSDHVYDVLVIGAGPAGLVTAVAASRAGARVLLVDRHPRTSIFPKATGLRPRTMELLRAWGLEDEVRAGAQDLKVAAAMQQTLTGPVLAEFPLAIASPELLAEFGPTGFALAPQDHLEPVLLGHLRELGAEVRFRVRVTDLAQDHDVVTVRATTDDGEETLHARWVVGADGAESSVRTMAGLGVQVLGDEGEHLSTLFRADLASHLEDRRYGLHLVGPEEDQRVFVPSGSDGRWMFDHALHADRGDDPADWTVEVATRAIREFSGVPDLDVEVIGFFPWTFGASVATGIQAGRVFLVGDAAHRTTPRGATGMNTGIADGHNLGWKLGWAARGLADESLLSSYAEERYPVGLRNALRSLVEMGPDNEPDLSHDFGVVYISAALQSTTAEAETRLGAVVNAVPGARAPHVWVTYAGQRLSTIDLLEGQLTLLTASEEWRTAAAAVMAPLQVLVEGVEITDPTGELGRRYGLGEGRAVLVRPDGYVAWLLDGADPERELADAVATTLATTLAERAVALS